MIFKHNKHPQTTHANIKIYTISIVIYQIIIKCVHCISIYTRKFITLYDVVFEINQPDNRSI